MEGVGWEAWCRLNRGAEPVLKMSGGEAAEGCLTSCRAALSAFVLRERLADLLSLM